MYLGQNLTYRQRHVTKTAARRTTKVNREISLLSAFLPRRALRTTPKPRTSIYAEILLSDFNLPPFAFLPYPRPVYSDCSVRDKKRFG